MQIAVITLFPELVETVTRHGMPRVAVEQSALELRCLNPRDHAHNKWRRVDERPYGGGPGMVMQAAPLARTIEAAKAGIGSAKVVLMSPQGERMSQRWFERLSQEPGLVLVCGRYEGVDERLAANEVDLELSLGDFVLSGGELAAMVLIDGIARLLPGVLGDAESAPNDSFSAGLLDHPHYTRPEDWGGEAVPEVLMGGNHAEVARWRLKQALGRTWLRRPDLLDKLELDAQQMKLLRAYIAEQVAEQKAG